ncbi:hypothetical protein SLEP1_g26814 [Rubroshorea leprosula]|uniref:Reverse transcriptase domain-containing protein n=1 Tax=Rubroshorea leprosula TaxID=152421 RepID=A0AAV5JY04_9ROSI|nr:hypothetical protein SLEP1_g26814 [Rubroshorea leprosula]
MRNLYQFGVLKKCSTVTPFVTILGTWELLRFATNTAAALLLVAPGCIACRCATYGKYGRCRWTYAGDAAAESSCSNAVTAERSLNEIWIGTYKVRVKLAEDRYRRKIGYWKASVANNGKGKVSNLGRLVQPGQSYAQAVGVGNRAQADGSNARERSVSEKAKEELVDNGDKAVSQHVDETVGPDDRNAGAGRLANENEVPVKGQLIEFTPVQEEVQWLEGSMVVVVKALEDITDIQDRMEVDGGSISLLPLGGRQFLLVERVQGFLSEFRQHNMDLFDLWFESIQPWTEAPSSNGRLIWLHITGVPLKAWSVRCFEKIGESVGEVIRLHEDTRNRAILSEGRVLVVSPEVGKISKSITLKVNEQQFEVGVVEEEWRTDPDWWLSDCDRRREVVSETEYSASQSSDANHDWINAEIYGIERDSFDDMQSRKEGCNAEIHGGEVDSIDDTQSRTEGFLNLKEVSENEGENRCNLKGMLRARVSDGNGSHMGIGPVVEKQGGLEECDGLGSKSNGTGGCSIGIKSNTEIGSQLAAVREVGKKELTGKTHKKLEECYPNKLQEICTNQGSLVTARTKYRQGRRGVVRKAESETKERVGSVSISDGCIANRNQVIRKDLLLHEVRKIIRVGKELGIELQDNEEEVESRLLVLEERDEEKGREETKLEEADGSLCRTLWYSEGFDWVMKGSTGASGGEWGVKKLNCSFVNVYAPNDRRKKVEMGKGLRQGDPLSPFLFLMIGEGLHGLVSKAETVGMFHGIPIGTRGLEVSLLQFADDTVIMGRAESSNIFMVKSILRWFELMSGLKINFSKSNVCGFNVLERWLRGASRVWQCGVGKTPFTYLGMPVGGKPGSKEFWVPVVNKFRAKLAVWKSTMLSVGGRITLLNSRGFLWGGAEMKRKIPWVNWELVCCSKMKGGLGVPDLRRRNWAVLGKWWARLGDEGENLWQQVVREKYYGGRKEVDITGVESGRMFKIWSDVVKIGGMAVGLRNLLVNGFKWEVGDGKRVGFWRTIWVGDKSLRDLFPRLYELAVKKEGLVSEMGDWEDDRWRWNMEWRRERKGRVRDEEEGLWELLESVQLKKDEEDHWWWIHGPDGQYVVKTAYEALAPIMS